MMLKKSEVLSVLRNINRRSLPIYYLEETVNEFGESHLEAFGMIDTLNKRIKGLEDAVMKMGKYHAKLKNEHQT